MVESEPNVGSTFIATLPMYVGTPEDRLQLASQNSLVPMMETKDNAQATGPTILFVEDNQETIFVHKASLRKSAYRLLFACTLEDARAAMKRETPALVVLDRLIGQEDCLFYIQELKSGGYAGPVMVVSVVDELEAAIEAGASAFLAKPVAHFTLLNTVRELIDGKSSRTILLSDDDEVTRYLLGDDLSRLGFRILEARNGREAVQMVKANQPNAMFLDIVMPGMNGFEVLREIRENPAIENLPIIIHSSKILSATEIELIARLRGNLYPKCAVGEHHNATSLLQILQTAGLSL